MRRRVAMLVSGLVALAFVVPVRAEDSGDAKGVIEMAIKAAGGEEKLAKIKAMTWKEKGTFYGMGDGLPYMGTYAVQWPDKYKMEIENVFAIVVNGDKGWVKQGDATDMSKEQLDEAKEERYAGYVSTLIPLKDSAYNLALIGEAKVADHPAVGVKVTHAGHREVKLYFDKESGMLVKMEHNVKDEMQGGKEIDQASIFSDFKDVDGVKLPHKVLIMREGKKFVEAEDFDIKPAEKLDAGVFAKPS
jgi:outer membrane lipoprotein-sorting protein